MRHHFFITGTDAGVGKTTLSALLCAALDAVYWKPIQTGTLEGSDRVTVMRLAGIGTVRTLDEVFKFVPPVSPDLAARGRRAGAHQPETVHAGPDGEIQIASGRGGAQRAGHSESHAADACRPTCRGTAGAWRGADRRSKPREPRNHRAVRPRPRDRRNSQASESAPHRTDAGLHESFRSRRLCAIIAARPIPGVQYGCGIFRLCANRRAPGEQGECRARN